MRAIEHQYILPPFLQTSKVLMVVACTLLGTAPHSISANDHYRSLKFYSCASIAGACVAQVQHCPRAVPEN